MVRISRLFVSLLLAGGLVWAAAPANAHVEQFDISDAGAITEDAVGVRGYIDCSNNHTFQINVTVTQDEAFARGMTSGQCASMAIPWEVRATVVQGTFEPGPAEVCARVITFLQGVKHGEITHCEIVQLS